MLSPFPGMDPFIEAQEWSDFHPRFNLAVSEVLAPDVEPRYIVRVERRIYVEDSIEPGDQWRFPDVAVMLSHPGHELAAGTSGGVATAPVECLIPEPVEHRETYLVIRERDTGDIVTIIETLSPTNKQPGARGQQEYETKREAILSSPTHLIELDLLRGGERPKIRRRPNGDYFVMISRAERRPKASIYSWMLRRPLPTIHVPLKGDDPEPALDLQAVFNSVYERARYQLSLDYSATLSPPASSGDQSWIDSILSKRIKA